MAIIKNVLISDKLKDILKEFKTDSKIAENLLLDEIDSDLLVDDHINYLCVSDTDSHKISYLTNKRAESIDLSDYWISQKRYHCKPGSLISKIFRSVSPSEVEKFSTLYRSFSDIKQFTFEVVAGDDISKYYNQQNYYSSGCGSLGNSCMKYDRCQNYFDIYKDNKDVLSMLIMKNMDGMLIGRALLWEFNNMRIMDRIYTVNDEQYQFYFRKWASNNDFICKSKQTWTNTVQFLTPDSLEIEEKLGIPLVRSTYDYYPYLDTFKWLDVKSKIIFNYKPSYFINNNNDYIVLIHPEGRYQRSEALEFDEITRDWHHQGALIEVGNIRTSMNNVNYSELLNRYVLKSESHYDEDARDYILNDLSKMDLDLLEKRKQGIRDEIKRMEDLRNRDRSSFFEISMNRSFTPRSFYEPIEPIQEVNQVLEMISDHIDGDIDLPENLLQEFEEDSQSLPQAEA